MSINRPLCIGHRGAAGHAPENTLASFAKAIELGVDMVELDVYDIQGQLIVIHDDTLDRTTNGAGSMYESSLDYIRSLDAGEGQHVPTLQEVMEIVAGKAKVNIEIKGANAADAVARFTNEELTAFSLSKDDILVSAFDHEQLYHFRELDSETAIGVLVKSIGNQAYQVAHNLRARSINAACSRISDRCVKRCHREGYEIFGYTANDKATIDRMLRLRVDGIFSDFPDRVFERISSM